ncbi:major histocompatibility complex class I-related gene protein-like isoform X1 [Anabas testudineus]|uniref:major histocompatibility complex class I-related gene protein-like isoform X1 n=1 Tax=Anabas testudineus TaxID=64144 RepID=UPI00143D9F45|nr:major histocompatibility complex class I-related gene protein-like isoform X1 [Anabas testudineus]
MRTIFLLLLFCYVSSSVKHSYKLFLTASSGIPNIPEFMITLMIDDIQAIYCDSNKKLEAKRDAGKKLLEDDPQFLKEYISNCFESLHNFFKTTLNTFMKHLNQSEGVHVLQILTGCDWDKNTGEVVGFLHDAYDGEDFMSLDLNKLNWIPLKPKAVAMKQIWDADKVGIKEAVVSITHIYPELLKKYLNYEKSFPLRPVLPSVSLLQKTPSSPVSCHATDLPSVSLLQKTPSSPVSCHATGFYPDRASMFWRKDGEEIHEDVDHGEILPNHDGTFQMRVDLNISSVKPEDWSRYDCVFHLSGAENIIITKLDKAEIRSKRVSPSEFPAVVIGVVVGLLLLLVCITGLFIWWKKKNNGFRAANTSDSSSPNRQTSDPL